LVTPYFKEVWTILFPAKKLNHALNITCSKLNHALTIPIKGKRKFIAAGINPYGVPWKLLKFNWFHLFCCAITT